uniref:tenomodulin n=1 Tax=Solea senegalensis TaxID=28829 RepID=UPI001CD8E5D1|nr:tenomodulin [Solea senegalensis]
MEICSQSSSQQVLWKDVEVAKEKKAKYHTYQRVALGLALVFLVLALSVFSLRYLWSPSLGKVYDHQYKAVLDGIETESMLEIDPGQRIEIFKMGNGSEEVLEVHDFKHGITGIRFAEHQRCYIRTQTRKLPTVAEVEAEDTELLVRLLPQPPVYLRISVPTRAMGEGFRVPSTVKLYKKKSVQWEEKSDPVMPRMVVREESKPLHQGNPKNTTPTLSMAVGM